jgi:predicted protein tyrosine phosphatase
MNYYSIIEAEKLEPSDKKAMISIFDYDIVPEIQYSQWTHHIKIIFEDIKPTDDGILFTSAMAKDIVEFVLGLPVSIEEIIIHCVGGVSRSAGVVKFLSKYMYPQCFNPKFDTEYSAYNAYVFKTLVKQWKLHEKNKKKEC